MSIRPWSSPAAGSSSTNCVSILNGRSQLLRDWRRDRHRFSETVSSRSLHAGGGMVSHVSMTRPRMAAPAVRVSRSTLPASQNASWALPGGTHKNGARDLIRIVHCSGRSPESLAGRFHHVETAAIEHHHSAHDIEGGVLTRQGLTHPVEKLEQVATNLLHRLRRLGALDFLDDGHPYTESIRPMNLAADGERPVFRPAIQHPAEPIEIRFADRLGRRHDGGDQRPGACRPGAIDDDVDCVIDQELFQR